MYTHTIMEAASCLTHRLWYMGIFWMIDRSCVRVNHISLINFYHSFMYATRNFTTYSVVYYISLDWSYCPLLCRQFYLTVQLKHKPQRPQERKELDTAWCPASSMVIVWTAVVIVLLTCYCVYICFHQCTGMQWHDCYSGWITHSLFKLFKQERLLLQTL